ncbi:MAG: tripartite tricarboxylate transporter substrate binding protein [Comamonas sp.]
MKTRRHLCGLLAAALCAAAAAPGALAAPPYPTKPVTVMVPYPAGGATDASARMYATLMGAKLGQPVLVENLGGVSGGLGAQKVLSAPADGYYLFLGSPNEVILSPLVNPAVKYKPQDFVLVQPSSYVPLVVLARKGLPVNSVDELIDLARKSAAAGAPLSYGTTGLGSLYHLVTENFAQRIGSKLTHAPYKGGAPMIQDLAGGQIDFVITAYQSSFDAMAEQGRMKMLASLGATRPETLKHLPTVNESRQLQNFSYTIWGGFFVRKGTPDELVQRLRTVIAEAQQDPAAISFRETQRSLKIPDMSAQEIARFFESETARYAELTKAVGVKAD